MKILVVFDGPPAALNALGYLAQQVIPAAEGSVLVVRPAVQPEE